MKLNRKIAEIRKIIARVRDDLKLDPDQPTTARLIMGEANVLWEMLGELNSRSLRGYGSISANLAGYIDPVGEKLEKAMNEIARLTSS